MSHRAWFCLILVCVAAGAACSDSNDGSKDDGMAGIGMFPPGGTGGVGTPGTGGTGTGVGTGGTGTGGTGTGGTGTGMNPAGCPTTAPVDGTDCTMADLSCDYAMSECQCESNDPDPAEWNCNMRGGMQVCPAMEPANRSTCTPGRGDCEFGERICDCVNDTDSWACWHPDDCPANPPAEDSACSLVGMECPYDVGGNSEDCDCEDTGWDCNGAFSDQDAGM